MTVGAAAAGAACWEAVEQGTFGLLASGSFLVAESLGQSGLAFELGRCHRCLSEGSRRCWLQGKRLEGVSQSQQTLLPPQSPFLLHLQVPLGAPHHS